MKKILSLFLISFLFIPGCTPTAISTPSFSLHVAVPSESISTPMATQIQTADPMDEKLALAPEIDGLNKEVSEKDGIQKVVYLYKAGNPYGGSEGEYAGEFKKEVTEKDPETGEVKEVGGVVLNPDVVVFTLNKLYGVLATGYTKKRSVYEAAMMIPLDITTLSESDIIDISYQTPGGGLSGKILVDFTGQPLSIVCPGKGENNYILDDIGVSTPGLFRLKNDIPTGIWANEDGGIAYDIRCEVMTKYITFEGDLVIDRGSYPELIRDISFIEGVSFGEEMAEVRSHLEFNMPGSGLMMDIQEEIMKTGKDKCLIFMKAD